MPLRSRLRSFLLVLAVAPVLRGVDLRVQLDSERDFYPEGAVSEFFVAARIVPPAPLPATAAAPAPRNIALVLDASGSMAGEPVQALRTATLGTIDQLRDSDTLSILSYGSEVETLIEASRVDQARTLTDRVARLETAGGAALYDALNQAAAQLRRLASPASTDELVLLVDGPPTRGPREADDFVRLATALSREGIRITTIGLGADFDEDLLAAIARASGGRFVYAATPADLAAALNAAVATTRPQPVARDLRLTLTFKPYCRELSAHGRHPAEISGNRITFTLPDLAAGQPATLLASATLWNTYAAVGHQPAAVEAELSWQNLDPDNTTGRATATLDLRFSTDARTVRESVDDETYRLAVDTLITDGLQDAIGDIDRGDFTRAQRSLQRTRNRVRDLAVTREDPRIAERLVALDLYLHEVSTRGLNQLDRKILRSGLGNAFDPPRAEEAESP